MTQFDYFSNVQYKINAFLGFCTLYSLILGPHVMGNYHIWQEGGEGVCQATEISRCTSGSFFGSRPPLAEKLLLSISMVDVHTTCILYLQWYIYAVIPLICRNFQQVTGPKAICRVRTACHRSQWLPNCSKWHGSSLQGGTGKSIRYQGLNKNLRPLRATLPPST